VIQHDKTINDLLDHLENYPYRFFTISELAYQTGLSPKTLSSRFKRETGQTVHQFQMDKKLMTIAAFLRSESYTSLKNLAVDFGFSSEFHLSSCFKKKFELSPQHYLKILQK
jgi:transcriptional regulator GlxA family with amidase domain